jgi:hypothetical protein
MFRTEISPAPSSQKITLKSRIFTTGSCFSNHIGEKLAANKFGVVANPFGVIFNPLSIFKVLGLAEINGEPGVQGYIDQQGICYHYDFHSGFSHPDRGSLELKLKETIATASGHIKMADWLLITFGTAFVYQQKENNEVVANCHKVPADQFTRRLLKLGEITAGFEQLYTKLKQANPKLKIILTVSPVRHIKDTLPLNNVSKSTLVVACNEICDQFSGVSYFPSYEIMLDDLRDYRFYEADMLHPNKVAVNYIWKKFSQTYFDDVTLEFLNEWEKILQALEHRPFHPTSPSHQSFIVKTIQRLDGLKEKVDVSHEIQSLKAQLL